MFWVSVLIHVHVISCECRSAQCHVACEVFLRCEHDPLAGCIWGRCEQENRWVGRLLVSRQVVEDLLYTLLSNKWTSKDTGCSIADGKSPQEPNVNKTPFFQEICVKSCQMPVAIVYGRCLVSQKRKVKFQPECCSGIGLL